MSKVFLPYSFVQGISTHSPTVMIGTGFSGNEIVLY